MERRKEGRHLYSPKVPEEYIPRLWRLARDRGRPMTQLVRDAVSQYLTEEEKKRSESDEQRERELEHRPGPGSGSGA